MNRIRNVFKLFLPVFCLLAGSCGYQLGGTKPPKLELAQTVKVCLFTNNSLEPRAATLVTGALADELQRDGTYRLSSGADADICQIPCGGRQDAGNPVCRLCGGSRSIL